MKEDDPFTLMALLVNSHTQDHTDKSDWVNGYAALLPVGDFEGGDLIFRELAIQVEFNSGSCALFRGHELFHSITPWTTSSENGSRYCFVLTTHEACRKNALGEGKQSTGGKAPEQKAPDDEAPDHEPFGQKSSHDAGLSLTEEGVSGYALSRLPSEDQTHEARELAGDPRKRKRSSSEEVDVGKPPQILRTA